MYLGKISEKEVNRWVKKNRTVIINICYMISLFLLTFYVYHEFILGNEHFVSSGNAMDLYDQFFPRLLAVARGIEKGMLSAFMNFTYGLGVEVNYSIFSLGNLPAYFGEENVAYLIGVFQATKVFFAALFFFFYLRKMEVSNFVSAVISICYAYCGHMIIRQFWLSYTNEVLLVAMWLWAFECFFKKKDFKWLPLVTFFFMTNIGSLYYVLMYVGLFSVYIIFRYTTVEAELSASRKKIILLIGFLLLLALIAVGVADIFAQFQSIFASDRFQSGVESVPNSEGTTALFTSVKALQAAFLRTIGIDIAGVKKNSYGEFGLLCDATFYIGIFSFLLLPICFVRKKGREKKWYWLIAVAACVYICSDLVRLVLNGFSSTNYKISSFWIIILALYCVATELDDWFKNPSKKTIIVIVVFGALLFALCKYFMKELGNDIQLKYVVASVLFLATYLVWCLCYYSFETKRVMLKAILYLLIIIEAGFMGYSRVDEMNMFTSDYISSRKGYNDYTVEALQYIANNEAIDDYRIDKQFFSYRYNDPMAQEYFGTSFYFGGTGIGNGIIDFYETYKLPTASAGYKYAYGTSISDVVNQVLGVKYIIAKTESVRNYGFEKVCWIEVPDGGSTVFVYENKQALPMVYSYDNYILRSDFENLSLDEKNCILLQACIVPDNVEDSLNPEQRITEANNWRSCDKYSAYQVEISSDGTYEYLPSYEKDSTIILKVRFNLEETEYRGLMYYYTEDGSAVQYRYRADAGENVYTYEINADSVQKIQFVNVSGETIQHQVEQCYIVPQEVYYRDYNSYVDTLVKNAMVVEHFSGKKVSGTIEVEKDTVLYFAAPYNKWHIYVDGEEVETFSVNIGFTGCEISAGCHTIEMVYESTEWSLNNVAKYMVFALVCIIVVYGYVLEIIRKNNAKKEAIR